MFVPELFGPNRIELLTEMYAHIESLMRSRLIDGQYPSGGWIPGRVANESNRLREAATSLEHTLTVASYLSCPRKLLKALHSMFISHADGY